MDTGKTWEEFNRYLSPDNGAFWGCVDKDGTWFDSASLFETAIHWCCYYHGKIELSIEQEKNWFENEGKQLGLSIIHSEMLKQMYAKGMLK